MRILGDNNAYMMVCNDDHKSEVNDYWEVKMLSQGIVSSSSRKTCG